MNRIKFERISVGWRAAIGDRDVEVIRSYPGDWFAYMRIAGKVCKGDARRHSYIGAMREAIAFLDRKVTPETWT